MKKLKRYIVYLGVLVAIVSMFLTSRDLRNSALDLPPSTAFEGVMDQRITFDNSTDQIKDRSQYTSPDNIEPGSFFSP